MRKLAELSEGTESLSAVLRRLERADRVGIAADDLDVLTNDGVELSKEDEVKSLFNDSGQQIVLVEVRPRQQTLTINIQGRKSLSIEWSTTKFKSALPEDLLADIIQLTGKGVEKLWTSDKAEIDLLSTEPLMSFSSVPEFGATLASDA